MRKKVVYPCFMYSKKVPGGQLFDSQNALDRAEADGPWFPRPWLDGLSPTEAEKANYPTDDEGVEDSGADEETSEESNDETQDEETTPGDDENTGEDDENTESEPDDLDTMSFADMKVLAKEMGIKGWANCGEETLRNRIVEAQNAAKSDGGNAGD